MAEDVQKEPVTVTAEERIHPAIRKLARACIALARLTVTPKEHEPAEEGSAAAREEQAHG